MDACANDRFETQTRTAVEVSVRATFAALGRDGAAGGGGGKAATTTCLQTLRELGRNLTAKITELYRDASSGLLRENRALRAKVGQLEAELKSNLAAGFQLESRLRSQVGRLRREAAHLDREVKRTRERAEKNRELLETERRERTLTGPVHVLLQGGSVLGSPVVSLYTNQMVSDPAALSVAILSSSVATGQTWAQRSAPLMVTSQPLPNLTSVPVNLHLTPQDAAAAAVLTMTQTSQNPLQSAPTANSQVTPDLQTSLKATGKAADGPPGFTAEENKPVASSGVTSETQGTLTKLSEDKPEEAGGKSAGLGKGNSQEKNRRRKEKNQQKRVFCEKCNKGFHYRHQLKQHMSCHDKPFSCDQCDKRFHEEKTLQTHLQAHKVRTARDRKSQQMWPCSQCDKQFRLQKNLEAHLLRHQAQKISFKCSVCEKTYGKLRLLKRHEAVHTGVRPFICDTCGKRFTTKSVLQEHRSIHSGEKPFTCATCGKTFRTSAHLFSHKRVHSEERPFKCSDCGKAFKLKRALVQHQIVHTGEKPFVCQMCGIGFGLKNNLQRHLRVHTGGAPGPGDVTESAERKTCRPQILQLSGLSEMFLQRQHFESSRTKPHRRKQINLRYLWEVFPPKMYVCLPHATSR
ncbi:zinc finger protein with KRAB and SCAN domains 1-like isoform X2 [Xiphias gladius]|uniref:zinc finger protein with KRAB and SCAN domains 1-like isoform X2 n=1 Tax=Xiphias gladius TaxID=8245 RepID=UPI001A985DC7|nr:zinc finger protein with KRAB and SCAN domains 1-like isoform X2 [Xiphias gladius]